MQLFAGLVVSLPLVAVANSNTSLPGFDNDVVSIIATDEEIAESRSNFEIAVINRAASVSDGENSYCRNDMRPSFPGCHQYGDMWCWATAIAGAMEYYTGGQRGDKCVGKECKVVSWTFPDQANCCPHPAPHTQSECGKRGAAWGTVQKSLNHFTGLSWQRPNGPLSKAALDAALRGGNPVILEIGDDRRPSHVVTIHGCDGNEKYWYHDPSRDFQEFLLVDYDFLLNQCVALGGLDNYYAPCQSPKHPQEIFRVQRKWWDTLYIPGAVTIV